MSLISVNGREIDASAGQSILTAALRAGIYIPQLCAHPDLPTHGGCKLCPWRSLVGAGPVQACETAVEDGMQVRPRLRPSTHLRTVALELMLAGHPKDCTSCAAYLTASCRR